MKRRPLVTALTSVALSALGGCSSFLGQNRDRVELTLFNETDEVIEGTLTVRSDGETTFEQDVVVETDRPFSTDEPIYEIDEIVVETARGTITQTYNPTTPCNAGMHDLILEIGANLETEHTYTCT